MFLGSRFYKSFDSEETIEFREQLSTLFFICIFDISVFGAAIVLVQLYLGINPATIALLACVGAWTLVDGLLPLLIQRRIVIDRKSRLLSYTGGAARFFFKTLKIPIPHIGSVVIVETAESAFSEARGPYGTYGKDIIHLSVRGRNDLKIDAAMNESYLNALAYELSEAIGCNVVTKRF